MQWPLMNRPGQLSGRMMGNGPRSTSGTALRPEPRRGLTALRTGNPCAMAPGGRLGPRWHESPDTAGRDTSPPRSGWARRDRLVPRTEQLTASSRLLYLIDHFTSLPIIAVIGALVLVAAVVAGAGLGFSAGWVTGFEIGTSFVTLVMVLVIQHTQGREQAATQRKLDELLRALPEAESGLMMLEEASDDTMRDVERDQSELKESVVKDD